MDLLINCFDNLCTSPQHPKAFFGSFLKKKDRPTLLEEKYLKPHAEGQGVHFAGEAHVAFVYSNRALRGHAILLEREHLKSHRAP